VATWFIRSAEVETTCVDRGYHTDQLHALVRAGHVSTGRGGGDLVVA
jgi:hypothetical protein